MVRDRSEGLTLPRRERLDEAVCIMYSFYDVGAATVGPWRNEAKRSGAGPEVGRERSDPRRHIKHFREGGTGSLPSITKDPRAVTLRQPDNTPPTSLFNLR